MKRPSTRWTRSTIPRCRASVRLGSDNRSSVEAGDDLPNLRRCMLAAERCSRNEIFTHREPADGNGLKANFPNEIRRDCKGVLVIARDWHGDQLARTMRILG